MKRILEAYTGEYASGKSENAVNRSLALARAGRKVTLVDLDLVEPVYTLRPLKQRLRQEGINVIAWETEETVGLGEAGSILHPAMRWALRNEGDVILDIGYGAKGNSVLNLLHGIEREKDLQILLVVNTLRPMTDTVAKICAYFYECGGADGIIANTHMGSDTTLKHILEGYETVKRVCEKLRVPLVALAVAEKFAMDFSEGIWENTPVRLLQRYLPMGFW